MEKFSNRIISVIILFILIIELNFFNLDCGADLTEEGWSEDIRVTYDNTNSLRQQLAVYKNNVHIVWEELRGERFEIYYKHSTDNGMNWGSALQLNENYEEFVHQPSIAVYGDNVHVVWRTSKNNGVIYYKRSSDNGNNWLPEIVISEDNMRSGYPKITVDRNSIYIIFSGANDTYQTTEVFFTKSSDNGENWSPSVRLSSIDGYISYPNDIVVNNEKIFVVWEEFRDDDSREIYFRNSNDFGNNWENEIRLSKKDDIDSSRASIAVCNNNIHVIWEDSLWTNNSELSFIEIGYTRSTNNGKSWDDSYYLSEEDGLLSVTGDIVANNNNVYVIWDGAGPGYSEIHYKTSQDNGETWNSEIIISDLGDRISGSPRMTNDQDSIYIAWVDERNDYYDIYFKLKENTPPMLTNGFVKPNYGDIFTNYNYTVIYTDIENNTPLFIYANINGINYSMNETDKNDIFFSDGKEYYFKTTLNEGEFHKYCYYTSDGRNNITTKLSDGPIVAGEGSEEENTMLYISMGIIVIIIIIILLSYFIRRRKQY